MLAEGSEKISIVEVLRLVTPWYNYSIRTFSPWASSMQSCKSKRKLTKVYDTDDSTYMYL